MPLGGSDFRERKVELFVNPYLLTQNIFITDPHLRESYMRMVSGHIKCPHKLFYLKAGESVGTMKHVIPFPCPGSPDVRAKI